MRPQKAFWIAVACVLTALLPIFLISEHGTGTVLSVFSFTALYFWRVSSVTTPTGVRTDG